MEGRLSEPPLAPPEVSLAIEKSLAKKVQLPTKVPALHEVAVVLDQYVLSVIGVAKQVQG
jgi:hypothetical protein